MTNSVAIRRWAGILAASAGVVLFTSCGGMKSGAGFRLPDGDVSRGRAAFERLDCARCHTIAGETFAVTAGRPMLVVPLGGEVMRVQTYGQLVTSIINPQHIVSPQYARKYTDAAGHTLMPDYGSRMTVAEMTDLVAFLQSHYRLQLPDQPFFPLP